jgi:hypothetical protein
MSIMTKIFVVATAVFVFMGCVTSSDLARLADIQSEAISGVVVAQEAYQERVEAILTDSSKDESERIDEIRKAAEVRNEALSELAKMAGTSVDQLVKIIQQRTQTAIEGVGTVTSNPLIDLILSVLAGAGAGIFGADKLRDKRRMARGEPVGPGVPLVVVSNEP